MDEHRTKSAVDRRQFLHSSISTAAGTSLLPAFAAMALNTTASAMEKEVPPLFRISLAQWSLHRMLSAGKLDNLDFPALTRSEFDIGAVEFVNSFFKDKAKDTAYLDDLIGRCKDADVKPLLIMIDNEGAIGDPDDEKRRQAVENHYRWVEAAKRLGCHSIRVNAHSEGPRDEQQKLVADGLRRLSEFAAKLQLNILVENHGGLSSDGKWLTGIMQQVDLPNCGTLPDFGNFRVSPYGIKPAKMYDRYQGVAELMPYAKAVSAKSHQFDAEGNETETDYLRMLRIVIEAGYRGYVGIEWEGKEPGEFEGIRLTKRLLERVRDELTGESAE